MAFVIDAVLILLVELIIGVSGVVIITVLHLPKEINAILADRQRRGFQDRLARTVVVRTSQLSIAAAQQVRTARPNAGQADPALVD